MIADEQKITDTLNNALVSDAQSIKPYFDSFMNFSNMLEKQLQDMNTYLENNEIMEAFGCSVDMRNMHRELGKLHKKLISHINDGILESEKEIFEQMLQVSRANSEMMMKAKDSLLVAIDVHKYTLDHVAKTLANRTAQVVGYDDNAKIDMSDVAKYMPPIAIDSMV
jgi:hypothetical protein